MGYARRSDANQVAIVDALRACGWHVEITSRLANFVDLVAGKSGRVELCEVKAPKGKRTEAQEKLIAAFAKVGVTVRVLRSVDDAIRL